MLYLIQQDSSFPVIESSFYGTNFYHSLLNLESPCKSPVIKNMLEAPKRVKHHKTRKKKAITMDQNKKIRSLHQNRTKHLQYESIHISQFKLLSFPGLQ